MIKAQQRHHSFVLRIWREEEKEITEIWRGWIQHAATGEVAYVGTSEDLLAFIETYTGSLVQISNVESEGNRHINSQVEEELK